MYKQKNGMRFSLVYEASSHRMAWIGRDLKDHLVHMWKKELKQASNKCLCLHVLCRTCSMFYAVGLTQWYLAIPVVGITHAQVLDWECCLHWGYAKLTPLTDALHSIKAKTWGIPIKFLNNPKLGRKESTVLTYFSAVHLLVVLRNVV